MLERIVIIGAGAVGGCIGGLLHHAGYPIIWVARGEHGQRIRDNGLQLQMPDRELVLHAPCVTELEHVVWRAGDAALIATKLQDTQPVLDALREMTSAELPVICASNGIHGEIWARARFQNVISMLIWMPSTYLQPGTVQLNMIEPRGVLDIGPDQGAAAESVCPKLADWLNASGFDSRTCDDIDLWKHAKWLTNLGNAAQALVVDDWKAVAKAAMAEGERVLTQAGVTFVPRDQLRERTRHIRMLPIDGQERPGGSTWQSRRRGQPLETPWIEGALADLAERYGLSAPINRYLADAARLPRDLLARDVLAVADQSP